MVVWAPTVTVIPLIVIWDVEVRSLKPVLLIPTPASVIAPRSAVFTLLIEKLTVS